MRPSRNECPSYLKGGFKKRGLGVPEEVGLGGQLVRFGCVVKLDLLEWSWI